MLTTERTQDLLKQVPTFADLSEKELEKIAEVAVPRRFESGQIIFREGDHSNTCYVLRTGKARATRGHADGRQITLANFGPGDIFGELAMFNDERRSLTVETLEETEVIAILGADMRRLLRQHAELGIQLISAMGKRLRKTNERIAQQSFQSVQSRVASVLVQLARDAAGSEELPGAPAELLIKTTQADIAQLAGSSRESASRFLAVLERANVISQGRGKLTLHDPAALERYIF